jgi:hypothetical protein
MRPVSTGLRLFVRDNALRKYSDAAESHSEVIKNGDPASPQTSRVLVDIALTISMIRIAVSVLELERIAARNYMHIHAGHLPENVALVQGMASADSWTRAQCS